MVTYGEVTPLCLWSDFGLLVIMVSELSQRVALRALRLSETSEHDLERST